MGECGVRPRTLSLWQHAAQRDHEYALERARDARNLGQQRRPPLRDNRNRERDGEGDITWKKSRVDSWALTLHACIREHEHEQEMKCYTDSEAQIKL